MLYFKETATAIPDSDVREFYIQVSEWAAAVSDTVGGTTERIVVGPGLARLPDGGLALISSAEWAIGYTGEVLTVRPQSASAFLLSDELKVPSNASFRMPLLLDALVCGGMAEEEATRIRVQALAAYLGAQEGFLGALNRGSAYSAGDEFKHAAQNEEWFQRLNDLMSAFRRLPRVSEASLINGRGWEFVQSVFAVVSAQDTELFLLDLHGPDLAANEPAQRLRKEREQRADLTRASFDNTLNEIYTRYGLGSIQWRKSRCH